MHVINVKKTIQDAADHRVSQAFVNEVSEIIETVIIEATQWGDNAADATGNGTLLVSHVPFYLVDHKFALDEAIQRHYDKIDAREAKKREREAKKSSKQFRELIDKENERKEAEAKEI